MHNLNDHATCSDTDSCKSWDETYADLPTTYGLGFENEVYMHSTADDTRVTTLQNDLRRQLQGEEDPVLCAVTTHWAFWERVMSARTPLMVPSRVLVEMGVICTYPLLPRLVLLWAKIKPSDARPQPDLSS